MGTRNTCFVFGVSAYYTAMTEKNLLLSMHCQAFSAQGLMPVEAPCLVPCHVLCHACGGNPFRGGQNRHPTQARFAPDSGQSRTRLGPPPHPTRVTPAPDSEYCITRRLLFHQPWGHTKKGAPLSETPRDIKM